jgi:[citrate (pro-3S)-lyase] ligase
MEIRANTPLRFSVKTQWETLLTKAGLTPDRDTDQTVTVWEQEEMIATGSRKGNLLKCIAVDPAHRGEDLTAAVLSQLRTGAFAEGHKHLFLYTKPENRRMFETLFFYPIAQTDQVLLMEDRKDGIQSFLSSLPAAQPGEKIGAAVMNCNPFTLGHRYLIETAAKACDHVYIFVLSEDQSRFSAHDRMEMVRLGTADLANVTVLPTGPYLISNATFPTYFLKDREGASQVHCKLDIAIFENFFVPKFGITHRYVGTEPLSPMTAQYNEALKTYLKDITLKEISRLEKAETPVSASKVRSMLDAGEDIRPYVPESTYQYLTQGGNNNG